jgi:ferric-dicitrate binding protein FerR (iron transport regulator)
MRASLKSGNAAETMPRPQRARPAAPRPRAPWRGAAKAGIIIGMIGAALFVTVLKYLVLAACSACWVYAAYHGVIFEGRLKTKDPREIEALNHPSTVFSRDISKRAQESRRRVFAALTIFAVLAVCLLVILFFDESGPPVSPFLFHDRLG